MHCTDKLPDLQTLSDKEKIAVLKKERNDAYLSRSRWIQACYDLAIRRDSILFEQLKTEELCQNCNNSYES